MRAAARLFLTRSFQEVGVDEICAAADVRKGSFYYYFPSKVALVRAVIDLHANMLWRALDSVEGDNAVDRLVGMGDAIQAIQSGFEERHGGLVGCPFGNLAAELSRIYPDLASYLASVLGELERRFAVACRAVADEGAWRPGIDPGEFAQSLNAFVQGTILLAKVNRASAAVIGRAFRSMVTMGLRDDIALRASV